METEKFQVNMAEGQTVLEIREGKAQNILDVKPPVKIDIEGTIGSPLEFLKRRFPHSNSAAILKENDMNAHFDPTRLHLLVDRDDVTMLLIIDEHDEYKRGKVLGKLSIHPKFIEFGINDKKTWQPNALGDFFKMNRSFFTSREANFQLVADLKNFVANIDQKIEKQNDQNGSVKDSFSAVVTSNLPGLFQLDIPIFKGTPKEVIEVEFQASVNGREITLKLISPAAVEIFEGIRDKVIDEQIEEIRKICPNIVIIEK